MIPTVGQRHVLLPPAVSRTFRKQLAKRVRAATNASQHVSQTPSPLKAGSTSPPSASRKSDALCIDRSLAALMSQFVSQIGDWWTPPQEGIVNEGDVLTVDELTDQLQSEMQNASSADAEAVEVVSDLKKASARPNIWKFLKPASLEELQVSRIMASLANASYYLPRLQFKSLLGKYGYRLVTTSLTCKKPATSAKLMDEAVMLGDGMGVSETQIPKGTEKASVENVSQSSNIVAAADLHEAGKNASTKVRSSGWSAQFGLGVVTGSVYSQTVAQLARQVTVAATVSQSAVTDTVTRVMKLLQVALRPNKDTQPSPETPPVDVPTGGATVQMMSKCPTEWFVCDDEKADTRIFCIQGTDNFESWQTNLTFDPVPFEDDALGVRVHRGIYEAAQGLYSLFVPLVRDYIESGSRKKICFSGHSLGGAIASVLLMMLVHRGDLPIQHVGQVFTFGGAASFCDSTDCSNCSLRRICEGHDPSAHRTPRSMLERLGLPGNTVVNVIMHKDIVPRAFACDYSLVADLLRRWSHSFRMHDCLTITGRSLLYNFIGEVHVLQPHEDCHYVCKEGYHPMLPQGAAVFKLVDPDADTQKLKEQMMAAATAVGEGVGNEVATKRDAFLALMDNPHPLDTLAETRAYGVHGAISRYHNPLNYAKGLRSVIAHNKKQSSHLFGIPLTPPNLPF